MIWRPDSKLTFTPSARHFSRAKPIARRFVVPPVGSRRPPGRPMLRQSFGALSPKLRYTIRELFDLIDRGPLRSTFLFPDTGFVTTSIYPQFWGLAKGRYVAFPEMIVAELSGWAANPLGNAYLHSWLPRAVQACVEMQTCADELFRVKEVLGFVGYDLTPFSVAVANKECYAPFGYEYYVNLLSLRKRLGVLAYSDLEKRLARLPTEPEFKQFLHKNYDQGLASIAFKGWKDRHKRNSLADEELVVTAALTAIATGRETIILTRDTDVFEQYVKLMHMLSADYACYRYAEAHYHNPEGCPLFGLDIPQERAASFGLRGKELHQVILPAREMDRLWPESFTPVHAYCVLVGNHCLDPRVSIGAFCLETEMTWMLDAKGRTGGKNTERFPGRNMVVGTSLLHGREGTLFGLVEEEFVTVDGLQVSWLDRQRAWSRNPLVTQSTFLPSY